MISFCVYCQYNLFGGYIFDDDGNRLYAHQNCYDIDKILEATIEEDDIW